LPGDFLYALAGGCELVGGGAGGANTGFQKPALQPATSQ
jgi:hypothetical protein